MYSVVRFLPIRALTAALFVGSTAGSVAQADLDLSVKVSLDGQTRCRSFSAFHEERLQLRLEFRNLTRLPLVVYFRDVREVQLAASLGNLLAGRPDGRVGGDPVLSPGFRGARYDMGPEGADGIEIRFATESIVIPSAPRTNSALRPGRYFLRVIEEVQIPVNPAQTQFRTLLVPSAPIEVTFNSGAAQLSPCSP